MRHETPNEWFFQDVPVNASDDCEHAQKVFLEWLRTGDGIFHVSGNPGSGKSTLMKFLSQNKRTRQELKAWAGMDTLVSGVVYFWNPGTNLQRTLIGLYRALLFQALSQCLNLTEEVFPVQFRTMRTSVQDIKMEEIQNFGETRIEEAFTLLLEGASPGGYRLCFFFDGLDECEGNRLQHEDLTNLIHSWTALSAVKICVSSRPYPEFLRPLNLSGTRLIQLHEINEPDIQEYCLNRLENDVYAQKRWDLCQRSADTVVAHAQGVFMWVHLVIDILLVGFGQSDPDSVLENKLSGLPRDLDMLYAKLRGPMDANSTDRIRSNRLLLLAKHNRDSSDLNAIAFSWLEEEGMERRGLMNPNFPQVGYARQYSNEEVSLRIEYVTNQIDGLARGFLEVYKVKTEQLFFAYRVRFCHRTARDYLLQSDDRRRALLQSFPTIRKNLLGQAVYGRNSEIGANRNIFEDLDRSSCQNMDPDFLHKFEPPICELVTPTAMDVPAFENNFDSTQGRKS